MTATLVTYGLPFVMLYVAWRTIGSWLLRAIVGLALMLVALAFVRALVSTPPTDVVTSDSSPDAVAVEPTTDAVPVPWGTTIPRWPDRPRCPAALDPRANLPDLRGRVDQLHGLRSAISQDRGVTAIVRAENLAGMCLDFVATQTNINVEPAIRDVLTPTEHPVWAGTALPPAWQVMHAEQKAVTAAWLAGYRPIALVSSAAFCSPSRDPGRISCQSWLRATLAVQVSDREAVWVW